MTSCGAGDVSDDVHENSVRLMFSSSLTSSSSSMYDVVVEDDVRDGDVTVFITGVTAAMVAFNVTADDDDVISPNDAIFSVEFFCWILCLLWLLL